MDADLKAKWLAALRSGDYKQTKYHLKTDEGFCCLGVLCDVIDNSKWRAAEEEPNYRMDDVKEYDTYYPYDFNGMFLGSTLGHRMTTRYGLNTPVRGDTPDETLELGDMLMEMNDQGGAPFTVIADYIEANL